MMDFNQAEYHERLAERVIFEYHEIKEEEESLTPEEVLSEAVFEVADIMTDEKEIEYCLEILRHSDNDPSEWGPFAETSEWDDILKALTLTVIRQDAYDVLQRKGYADGDNKPTSKLLKM